MTVHNLAYQGNFWHWDMLLTGLDWKYFNWTQMEFHGHLNLLKTGLIFADAISTVSRPMRKRYRLPNKVVVSKVCYKIGAMYCMAF